MSQSATQTMSKPRRNRRPRKGRRGKKSSGRDFKSYNPVPKTILGPAPVQMAPMISTSKPSNAFSGVISHPDFGDGARFSGSELLYTTIASSSDYTLIRNSLIDGFFTTRAGYLLLNPGLLGVQTGGCPRLAVNALNYRRYCYRRIRITFEPSQPTSYPGTLTYGITPGNYLSTITTPFAEWYTATTSIVPNETGPYYVPSSITYTYKGDSTWLVGSSSEPLSTLLSDPYQQLSYVVAANALSGALETTLRGYFRMDYVVDFFGPISPRISITPSLLSSMDSEARKRYEAHLKDIIPEFEKSALCSLFRRLDEKVKDSKEPLEPVPLTRCESVVYDDGLTPDRVLSSLHPTLPVAKGRTGDSLERGVGRDPRLK